MRAWRHWLTGAAAAASLASAPALAQGYNNYPPPPPGQGMYGTPGQQDQYQQGQQDDLDFRGTLSPYGEWINVPGVGEVWRPYERVVGSDFQPYVTSGHWVLTDYGWSWESDHPWGWAAFHYGRWVYRPRWGWLWRPARVWAPAWVEWRTGSGYVGWSPMAPEGVEYMEPSLRASWCFVDTANFVSFRLNSVRFAPERVRMTFGTTTPLHTRRTYRDGTFYVGPPPAHVSTAVGHPIRPIDMNTYQPRGAPWRGHMPSRPPVAVAPPQGPSYRSSPPPPGMGMGVGVGGGRYAPPPPSSPVVVSPPPARGGNDWNDRRDDRHDRQEERRERQEQRFERQEERRDQRDERRDEQREQREDRHDDRASPGGPRGDNHRGHER